MRFDAILDVPASGGAGFALVDHNPAKDKATLIRFVPERAAPLRREAPPPPARLADNPIPKPDFAGAARHEIVFAGGAAPGHHGPGRPAQPARRPGNDKPAWTLNGQALIKHAAGHGGAKPLLTLKRGATLIVTLKNETIFDHPMHLHGFVFQVLSRNGKALAEPLLTDTILMSQRETAEIAFVADNPGDWMLHCHILEHADAGMGAIVRVA
jgi:FtsP/CotA-like multicopper oxidase with cupredoxin domain